MSAQRAAVAAVSAFLATGISVDPSVRAVSPPPPRARAPIAVVREPLPSAHALGDASGPAPRDVELEVRPDGHGAQRVVVRRRGFLVALRNEDARSAGMDWTAMRIASREGAKGGAAGRLIWETTRPDGFETSRGFVVLRGDDASIAGELSSSSAPELAASWKSAHATCAGLHDGLGGFTVLCRPSELARVSGIANVTGARSLDDAWLVPGSRPLVRFDLAASPDGAEGRVLGLTRLATGVVITVEASFPRGEEPTLVFHEATRAQPTPSR